MSGTSGRTERNTNTFIPIGGVITTAEIALFHAAGLKVCVYTLNTELSFRGALTLNVDALTTDRPYRAKMTPVDALGEITSQSGQQFDPRLVDIFRQFIQLRYLGMQ